MAGKKKQNLMIKTLRVLDMIIKSLQTDDERKACLEIARNLPEWFNEAGLKAIVKRI